jgi:hypothetical protein
MSPGGIESALEPRLRARLRSDDNLITRLELLEELTKHLLGDAIAIDISGIDEGSARVEECGKLVSRVKLIGSASPRHRPEGEATDPQAGSSEGSLLHNCTLLGPGRPWAAGADRHRLTITLRRHICAWA